MFFVLMFEEFEVDNKRKVVEVEYVKLSRA